MRNKKESWGERRKLPDERDAITHKFSIAGHDGYIIVGLYDDGMPGEVFIRMNKEGSVMSGSDGCCDYINFNIATTRRRLKNINGQTKRRSL